MSEFIFEKSNIGIIGYGQFGQLLHKIFLQALPHTKILIYSRGKKIDSKVFFELEKVMDDADIIIPAVPINQFEKVIKQITPHLTSKKILIDVCSVKEYPVKIMKKNVHPQVTIIATHPLFGPKTWSDARRKNMVKKKIVISRVQGKENVYKQIVHFFGSLGLITVEMSPKKHDELQAQSQFFVQTVRSVAKSLRLKKTTIDTPSASLIFKGISAMGNSHELYVDMIRYNSACREILEGMKQMLDELLKNTTLNL